MNFARFLAVVMIAGPAAPNLLRADDWPQWRGLHRDGTWRESGIVERIPESGLQIRWRAKIGNGYSGPAVAAGRVYVTDHRFKPEVERVLCFEEATGKPLWEHSYSTDYATMEYGNGPRATPTVHGNRVYTLGTQGDLSCLDVATGEPVWKKNLVKDFDAKRLTYGFSSAPLVVDDLLIVFAGGLPDACVVALDRNTGAERWRALEERNSYSAPILIEAGGKKQLIAWTADSISSLEPATGKILWSVPRKSTFDEAEVVAAPVLFQDLLLCMGAWSRGSTLLKLDAAKPAATIVWKTRQSPTTFIGTPIFPSETHFYAPMANGTLACLDAKTGDEVWATQEPTGKRMGTVHMTPNGDRVFLFNQVGWDPLESTCRHASLSIL